MNALADLTERADTALDLLARGVLDGPMSPAWQGPIARLAAAAEYRRGLAGHNAECVREAEDVLALLLALGVKEQNDITSARDEMIRRQEAWRECHEEFGEQPDRDFSEVVRELAEAIGACQEAQAQFVDWVLIALAGPWLPVLRGEVTR